MTKWSSEGLRLLAVRKYSEGFSCRSVAKDVGYSYLQVSRWVKDAGVDVNHDYFKNNRSDVAGYLLGLIATDGCVMSPRGRMKSSTIVMKSKDRWITELFAKEFRTNVQLSSTNGRIYWRVSIPSEKIAVYLNNIGIVPRKTYNLKVNGWVLKSVDFWRGAIDGDGCVGNFKAGGRGKRYPGLILCGAKNFVMQFCRFVKGCGYEPSIMKTRKKSGWYLYSAVFRGRKAIDVANILYYDGCVALERKFEIVKGWNVEE